MNSFTSFRFLLSLLLAMGFLACDRVGQDLAPAVTVNNSDETEFYTLPAEPVAIDLKSFVDLKSAATFTIVKRPQSGEASFSPEGLLIYTPNPEFTAGQDQFALKTTDSDLSSKAFRITMAADSSQLPCHAGLLPDGVKTSANTPVTIDVLENARFCNATVDLKSVALVRAPKNGKLSLNGTRITYTPNQNFVGYDELLYKVTATVQQPRTYVATVKILVGDIYKECSLTLKDDQVSLRPQFVSDSVLIAPLLNDQLCQPVRTVPITIKKGPSNGLAVVQRNQYIVYWARPGFTGNDELIYQRCDNGSCLQATIRINVKAPEADCQLTAAPDSRTIQISKPAADVKAGTVVLPVLLNDKICAPLADMKISANPANLKLTVSKQGIITYTLSGSPKVGQLSFSYELTDTQNNKSSATVTIDIKE
ncbi:Ig-like domain-containing protein [Spirosoma taeanense]|uniref:Ig-like domain-containing protein n=1 Tax=Spirosoma taeanense TaxID=2735870 RepID=A0A6M5YBU9_9BACT|nr:Ig-like domain-containing protein [Spirosoma taeanense]QJW91439.1 Ig-like domain-containing protein [Spirosoma taeanense]